MRFELYFIWCFNKKDISTRESRKRTKELRFSIKIKLKNFLIFLGFGLSMFNFSLGFLGFSSDLQTLPSDKITVNNILKLANYNITSQKF